MRRASKINQFSFPQIDHLLAEVSNDTHVMRDKKQSRSLLAQLTHSSGTLLLKEEVSHAESFIDDQDFRLDCCLNRECQPNHHAAGIGLDWLIDELSDLRKTGDLVKAGIRLLLR